jgi:hypothetical protein
MPGGLAARSFHLTRNRSKPEVSAEYPGMAPQNEDSPDVPSSPLSNGFE